jgi:hypothetical protein
MQINENEIDTIEEIGMLDKKPVKLIRLKGGFFIACGKPKGKYKEEALAAGSHPSIVKYNLQKQYSGYEPMLAKSEAVMDISVVDKHSHLLSEELIKSGHDIYSIQNGNQIEFQITKQNVKIGSAKCSLENDSLIVKNIDINKEFSHVLACAATEKALNCGTSMVKFQG